MCTIAHIITDLNYKLTCAIACIDLTPVLVPIMHKHTVLSIKLVRELVISNMHTKFAVLPKCIERKFETHRHSSTSTSIVVWGLIFVPKTTKFEWEWAIKFSRFAWLLSRSDLEGQGLKVSVMVPSRKHKALNQCCLTLTERGSTLDVSMTLDVRIWH